MKILELMSNYGSFTTPLIEEDVSVFRIDEALYPNLDFSISLSYFDKSQIDFQPDLIWARIPGTHFSVASMGKHWDRDNNPQTSEAIQSIKLVENVTRIIEEFNPKCWGIECTRGKLRTLDLIDNQKIKYSAHPVVWAPFSLVGSGAPLN